MKILVTGSSGMIGSELVPALIKAGHEVVGLDRREPSFSPPPVFVKHDLLEPLEMMQELQNLDMLIHLAAHARVPDLVANPDLAKENLITTHNAFEFARKNGIKKFLFASSREVYGHSDILIRKEETGSQRKAASPYSASKIMGEAYSWAYTRSFGLDVKIVRLSNAYGKYDFSDRFIPNVIRLMKQGADVMIYDIKKLMDFIHVTDIAEGIMAVINKWDKTPHKEFNIASGRTYSLVDVAKSIKNKMNSNSEIVLANSRPGEVLTYQGDVSRMLDIGWSPRINIDEGLDKSIEYYLVEFDRQSK